VSARDIDPYRPEDEAMSDSEQKVLQYLNEAHASEVALVRVLQAQILMAPHGSHRSTLESHLRETREHARRLRQRAGELGSQGSPVRAVVGLAETAIGQLFALGKAPLDLLRGCSGEEKVLKNAKDACASEALEIATYTALERLAEEVNDPDTARLAASIREDEQRMLDRLLDQIPALTTAVVRADVEDRPSYEISDTGMADAARKVGRQARQGAGEAASEVKRTARSARKLPGVARAEGQVKGAVASERDLAISGYDKLNATEIISKLADLSQVDLAKVEAYERRTHKRGTILAKISTLQASEPWPGYDELNADEIRAALSEDGEDRAGAVRAYERSHKNRSSVLEAAERQRAHA
jgi:ferritin-like metal-binding protein YciE